MKLKILLFFILLLLAKPCLADNVWNNQNFEDCSLGDVADCYGWSDVVPNQARVTDSLSYEGNKSLKFDYDGGYYSAYYNWDYAGDLYDEYIYVSFVARKHTIAGDWSKRAEITMMNGNSYQDTQTMIQFAKGNVRLMGVESTRTLGTYEADSWVTVVINFDPENNRVRAKIDDNDFCEWSGFILDPNNMPYEIETLRIFSMDTAPFYIDDIKFFNSILPPFAITSPEQGDPAIDDSYITVEGVCPTDGVNQIGFTNDCLGFDSIDYNVDCALGLFSYKFFKSGNSDIIIARDKDSLSSDCVAYDDLVDIVEVDGFQLIEGYPDEWYYNFDYYDDYNININYPVFDTALTLPIGATSSDFSFNFTYPEESLENLNFNIKQYDSEENLLNGSYHNKDLSDMASTSNYIVNLVASSTQGIHYVVQLTENGEMKRQYPFGIFISDFDAVINPDNYDYLFPRLVEELRKKVVFNYYFAFHDGFYEMFNNDYASSSDEALDITFNSVSGDQEYDLDIQIFSASDPRVKSFASGIRPYVIALLWLSFGVYVIYRITHLFSDNE